MDQLRSLALAPDASLDRTLPPHRYTPAEWEAFIAGVHAGEFDRP